MKQMLRVQKEREASATLLHDDRGLSTVEYVIILVLIAAASIGLWVTLGGQVQEKISEASEEFDRVEIEGNAK